MRTSIIVDNIKDETWLKFTQTKLFFDEGNIITNMFDHCVTVDSYTTAKKIAKGNDIVLDSGTFLTEKFVSKHRNSSEIVYAKDDEDVIKFDTSVHPMSYLNTSEVVNSLYWMVQTSRDRIWLEQTQQHEIPFHQECKHFYGLASGWQSMMHCVTHQYETVTLFDYCQRQVDFSKALHSQMSLPEDLPVDEPVTGNWKPPQIVKDNWSKWHSMDVNFKKINLLDTPIFPKHSLVWVSNVFNYEPTLFEHGYEKIRYLEKQLAENNSECILVESKAKDNDFWLEQ